MSLKAKKNELAKRYGSYCFFCDKKFKSIDLQCHHIIPRYFGGTDDYYNLSLVCPTCHVRIHHYHYKEKEYQDSIKKIMNFKNSVDKNYYK